MVNWSGNLVQENCPGKFTGKVFGDFPDPHPLKGGGGPASPPKCTGTLIDPPEWWGKQKLRKSTKIAKVRF